MAESLFQLVYTSTASKLLNDDELINLLFTSKNNNKKRGITGMLLYSEGSFIQALEGSKQSVLDLYHVIAADPRHHGSIILTKNSITERQFSRWEMGFKSLSRQELVKQSGYSQFLNNDFNVASLSTSPSTALKLLLSFRKNMP